MHGISEQLEWFIALAFKSAHALYKQLGGDCDADFSALAQLVSIEVPAHRSFLTH
jgi:hypothetical protein